MQSKYHNQPCIVDGKRFASKGEARRYQALRILEADGWIANLQCQVRYPIRINDVLVCTYIADFVYVEDGEKVVEDYKGARTAVYRLKAKLMQAVYGITIKETSRRDLMC